jgi:uncharacterized protein (DUF1778 family)
MTRRKLLDKKPGHIRRAPAPDTTQKGAITLSVRFTEEQRERLATAAFFRGWTPTNLLRVAALEKAAYVVNTHAPNKVNFRKIAETVAACLMGGKQLGIRELKQLHYGAHLGGGEFLNMIIDSCLAVVAQTQTDLPDPIDPSIE